MHEKGLFLLNTPVKQAISKKIKKSGIFSDFVFLCGFTCYFCHIICAILRYKKIDIFLTKFNNLLNTRHNNRLLYLSGALSKNTPKLTALPWSLPAG